MVDRHRHPQRLPLEGTRVDRNHVPVSVDEGTAAVAWIDGGVRLNEGDAVDRPNGTHDASSHRVLQDANRRANGRHLLPDT